MKLYGGVIRPVRPLHFNNLLLGTLFIYTVILLQGVSGDAKDAIFDLRLFIVELWVNLCSRLGETFSCFLKVLPTTLGGENKSCIT
ncbi:unnamed protein product [Heterobilharzia americana]|nr:unnamed protein product [Heterobilharzia americana]CAH8612289.1 unnamed protein product [Heterobilharzia americana]